MKNVEISDKAYETLAHYHGDVSAFVERMADEAAEVAAVQVGIDAYEAGEHRPLEKFGEELRERYNVEIPKA
jgi:hypothetical protein